MTTKERASVDQVIRDFRNGAAPRDPYDDLFVLVDEVQRLRSLIWKAGELIGNGYTEHAERMLDEAFGGTQ